MAKVSEPDEAGRPREALAIDVRPDESTHQKMAETYMSPVVRGAVSAKQWIETGFSAKGLIGVNEAVQEVKEQASAAASGDLDAAKRMLMAQAVTLDAIFNEMARKAAGLFKTNEAGGWSYSAETMESLTRTAFKAQGQCRATLQTLGELVNPRSVAFIKQAPGSQANVATGPQQVNNGEAPARPQEMQSPTNKLLEANPSERLDLGAQATTGRSNQALEPLEAVHGAENGGGQVRSFPKRAKAR